MSVQTATGGDHSCGCPLVPIPAGNAWAGPPLSSHGKRHKWGGLCRHREIQRLVGKSSCLLRVRYKRDTHRRTRAPLGHGAGWLLKDVSKVSAGNTERHSRGAGHTPKGHGHAHAPHPHNRGKPSETSPAQVYARARARTRTQGGP